jgi:transposase
MLTAKGVKPVAVSRQVFESARLFGVFPPMDGKRLLMETECCNSDFFQVFLDKLSATDTDELMLIVLDNAFFHHSKKLKIPDNIALIYLPPYSPELNSAEKIRQRFKRVFTNKPFKTMEEVRNFLTEQTKLLSDSIVISTCAYQWMSLWNNWTI